MTQHDPDPYARGTNGDAPPDPNYADVPPPRATGGEYDEYAAAAPTPEDDDDAELIRAAEGSTKGTTRADWRPPRNFLILGLVVFIIAGVTIYLFGVYLPKLQDDRARIRLRVLQKQEATWYDNERYRRLFPGMAPPNEVVEPLTEAERADLARLRQRYGVKPPEREPLPPPPRPATSPATTGPVL